MRRKTKRLFVEAGFAISAICILAYFTIPHFLHAQTINDEDHFPDPAFRSAVEKFMGVQTGEPFSASAAARQKGTLRCREGVRDLAGIQFLKSMTSISVSHAQVTRADFSKNPSLISIHLDMTPIATLDLSKSIKLKDLFCRGLKVSYLDFSNNPNLMKLDCRANGLTGVDVSSCKNLRQFLCMDNVFTQIDLSHNSHLRYLCCYNNRLKQLDLSNNPELHKLHCGNNQLSRLDLSKNPCLEVLHCSNNAIKEIVFCDSPKFTSVDCSNNRLKSVEAFVDLKTLYYLDVRSNDLDDEDGADIGRLQKWFTGDGFMLDSPPGSNPKCGFFY